MFFGDSSTAIDLVAVTVQPLEACDPDVRPGRGRKAAVEAVVMIVAAALVFSMDRHGPLGMRGQMASC